MLSGTAGPGMTLTAGLPPGLTAAGLMALHVGLSALVPAHVLLRKSEVGAAIGWIGLAWLSPFLGSGLYFLFGINRVRQRARTLGHPRHLAADRDAPAAVHRAGSVLAAIDRTAHRVSRRRALPGNAVLPLANGDAA